MTKYLKLTRKLVWFEYFGGEVIFIDDIVDILSILAIFRYLFLPILKKLEYFHVFWIFSVFFDLKITNVFKYIIMIQVFSSIQNISSQVGFGFSPSNIKNLDPFEY